jgi:adenosylcobinamide-phosphate synthase
MIYIAVLPVLIGFALDCIIGDPYSMPHPVKAMGSLITKLEGIMRRGLPNNLRLSGALLAVTVLIISAVIPLAVLILCYCISIWLGIVIEGILCCFMLAARCLRDESMKVYRAISRNDTESARRAVSVIVGRDTDSLDREGIIRAAVETVAENTSDGVTAPMLYMICGAPLGYFYKAANTMDSMLGYKNEKYIDFGRFAARLDDVLNYIPSRLTALMMIVCSFILAMDSRNAYRIWRRDRHKHASPNSAQTESVCAGALGIRLAGDAYYQGRLLKKNYIGDELRQIEAEDIKRANKLMYGAAIMTLMLTISLRIIIAGVIF